MKKNAIIQGLATILLGLAVGFIIGITITNPGMSLGEAVGTIGRVDQYRNVRITEADIELRNELLSDENMREAYIQYLTFEYANNILMADNISYAMEAARTSPEFRATNTRTLSQMEEYAIFLDNGRLNILEALATISDLSDKDRIAIRTVLNNAGNAISQTITRSNAVFNYLREVEDFFTTASKDDFPMLVNAHDRLFTNLMAINLINENRPVLEYLLAKGMMDEESELAQLDMESLQDIFYSDAEKLSVFFDQATLQHIISNMAELQSDAIMDGHQLRQMMRGGETLDMEALRGSYLFESEKLRTLWNQERLDFQYI